jgi:hypothetical protein
MRKSFISLVSLIALGSSAALAGAADAADVTGPAQSVPARLARNYSCTTTQANNRGLLPQVYLENDTIEFIGQNWQHGTARLADGSGKTSYDYYLGYVDNKWVYIQIDPLIPESQGYFVGMSPGGPGPQGTLNGSTWRVVSPAGEGTYNFTESASGGVVQWFRIAFADLNQFCVLAPAGAEVPPAATPATSQTPMADLVGKWKCLTTKTGQDGSGTDLEDLTVSQLGANWWQGRATTMDGKVVYEYNLFSTHTQRVLIQVNAFAGSYEIATSFLTPTLQHSTWTVIFPTVENGFTFEAVPPAPLNQEFRVVFADGTQTCTRAPVQS